MKTVQKFFVFGLFATAGLIFAGCGETDSTSGGGDGGSATATEETSNEGSGGSDAKEEAATEGSAEKTDGASTAAPSGEFQLVSLNVPNMT